MPIFCDQSAVGRDIDLKAFFVADIEQFIDFGVKQRLSFYVQINVLSMRLDLVQPFGKVLDLDKIGFALGRRAKGTGKIADAGDFYINFLKCFQDIFPILNIYDRMTFS